MGTSAVEVITKREFKTDTDTTKSDKRIQFFRNITCPKDIQITAVEISSGHKKQEDLLISKFIAKFTGKKISGETNP